MAIARAGYLPREPAAPMSRDRVLSGRGTVTGGDDSHLVGPGDVIAYAPGELHGMRAGDETFLLLATIIRSV